MVPFYRISGFSKRSNTSRLTMKSGDITSLFVPVLAIVCCGRRRRRIFLVVVPIREVSFRRHHRHPRQSTKTISTTTTSENTTTTTTMVDNSRSNSCNDLWGMTVNELFSSSTPHTHNSLQQCCLACAVFTLLVFVVSERTKNYSQVDKLWSITPLVYTWILVTDARTILMASLVTLWGVRLTWNFNRRGGYTWPPWRGDEDYRWKYIQDGYFLPILQNKVVWTLFNLGFISIYQNLLLMWITMPSVVAYLMATKKCNGSRNTDGNNETFGLTYDFSSLNRVDAVASVLFVFFVVLESIADNQQYHFQQEKYRRRRLAGDGKSRIGSPSNLLEGEYADGFTRSGLFAFVRKPNYASEQAIWMSFYLFSIAACLKVSDPEKSPSMMTTTTTETSFGFPFFNWSSIGWILLCALFQVSGWFTEKITLSKYPAYQQYMEDTPMYIPNPFQIFLLRSTKLETVKKD